MVKMLAIRLGASEDYLTLVREINDIKSCAQDDHEEFNSLYENSHFMRGRLFTGLCLRTVIELVEQMPMGQMLFEQSYIDFLRQVICENSYASYSKHLWNIS